MSKFVEQAHKRLNSQQGLPQNTPELERCIIEYYEGGLEQKTVGELYGVSQGYVSRVLKKYGIPTRRNNPPPPASQRMTRNK